jgi:hypothetical protein
MYSEFIMCYVKTISNQSELKVKGKDKVVPLLFLTERYTVKMYLGEWRYSFIHSLTLALDGGEWSASCPGHFTPRERAPGIHWIGGWVGPRTILDVVVERKIPSPHWKLNPRT